MNYTLTEQQLPLVATEIIEGGGVSAPRELLCPDAVVDEWAAPRCEVPIFLAAGMDGSREEWAPVRVTETQGPQARSMWNL